MVFSPSTMSAFCPFPPAKLLPLTPAAPPQSRVNRLSVLSAITSTQQRLKLYNRVPTNGLVLYCGTVLTEDGKEKQVSDCDRFIRL
jgi:hypothetical protein